MGSGLAVWLAARVRSMRTVLGVALALRLLALPVQPTLSDDVYRYLWDGRLIVSGESPYAHRPSDAALAGFRTEGDNTVLYERMNSQGVYSVYPPLSQAGFAAAAVASSCTTAWWVLKLLLVLAEVAGMLALSRVLTPSRLALYAWQPLAVMEIAGQGHSEGLLVGAIGVAIWAAHRARPGGVVFGLSLAGFAKLYPFVAVPALWLRCSRPVQVLIVAFVATLGATMLPADGIAHIAASLRLYGGALDWYAAPFLTVKAAFHAGFGEAAGRIAATGLSLVWLAGVGWTSAQFLRSRTCALTLLQVTVLGYLIVSPMLHPWNGLGALLVASTLRNPSAVLWLLGIAPLTYLRYVDTALPVYPVAVVIGWAGAGWWLWRSYTSASASSRGSASGPTGISG